MAFLLQLKHLKETFLDIFNNFAVDGVSLENNDVVTTTVKFLAGTYVFIAGVDNNHCIKNDRHKIIGGSCADMIGDSYVDSEIRLKTLDTRRDELISGIALTKS